jgi:5-methylcytosine-specific restriction enzyme A
MPMRALHPCNEPGCAELIRDGRYCSTHNTAHIHLYEHERGTSAQRGYGARWQRLRRMFLAAHPICEDPDQVHPAQVVPATDVDHIVSLRDGGSNREENLQALCHACHSHKTAKENGRWG